MSNYTHKDTDKHMNKYDITQTLTGLTLKAIQDFLSVEGYNLKPYEKTFGIATCEAYEAWCIHNKKRLNNRSPLRYSELVDTFKDSFEKYLDDLNGVFMEGLEGVFLAVDEPEKISPATVENVPLVEETNYQQDTGIQTTDIEEPKVNVPQKRSPLRSKN